MAHAILSIKSSLIDEIKTHYVNNNVFSLLFINIYRDYRFIEEMERKKRKEKITPILFVPA